MSAAGMMANPIFFIVETECICQQISDARPKSLGLACYATNI